MRVFMNKCNMAHLATCTCMSQGVARITSGQRDLYTCDLIQFGYAKRRFVLLSAPSGHKWMKVKLKRFPKGKLKTKENAQWTLEFMYERKAVLCAHHNIVRLSSIIVSPWLRRPIYANTCTLASHSFDAMLPWQPRDLMTLPNHPKNQ